MSSPEQARRSNGELCPKSIVLLQHANAIAERVRGLGERTKTLVGALLKGWTEEGKSYRALGALLEPFSSSGDTEQTCVVAVKILLDACDIPPEVRAQVRKSHHYTITAEEALLGGVNAADRYKFGQVDFTKRKKKRKQIDWTIYDAQLAAFVAAYRTEHGEDTPVEWRVIADWMNAHEFSVRPPKPFTRQLCRSQWVNRRRQKKEEGTA